GDRAVEEDEGHPDGHDADLGDLRPHRQQVVGLGERRGEHGAQHEQRDEGGEDAGLPGVQQPAQGVWEAPGALGGGGRGRNRRLGKGRGHEAFPIRAFSWALVGRAGTTPAIVTVWEPATAANSAACSTGCPSARATAKAAVKESPAPVVSTTFRAGCGGTVLMPEERATSAPAPPRVMTTVPPVRSRRAWASCSSPSP